MSKRTVFTTITPLPAGISRETVMETLHDHLEMIDLNPLVEERHLIKPPPNCTAEEYHCAWYALTDKVQYLPGGLASGKVTYNCCFHDLTNGIQTHCYAPMGLNIKGKWTLCGSLPGEPVAPVELGLGAPLQGLYVREDVDMKCNMLMTSFVKKTLKKAHMSLVARIMVKAQIVDAALVNEQLTNESPSLSRPVSNYAPSTVEYDSDSITNVPSSGSPQLPSLYGLQSPPLSQHPLFRADTSSSDFRDSRTAYDASLYPQALSIRSGSSSGSQKGRSSYLQESGQNGGSRVSWSQLSAASSVRNSGIQQEQNPYRVSAMSYHVNELPAQLPQRQDQGVSNGPPPQYQATPSQSQVAHYPVELE
ncbi:hypothetical protein G7Y89_g790 [Cudoniella acicularis]|uniref:DUF7053 domain-containing protein n=1 Tax=Cudoniella acicularis TaxID=354080 RepID=A0A8H4WA40_9HELO|nr:hypothetical protein G7Y89_g790 [Cudoniella acicularis]